jgi:hypothetical protein
MSKIRIQPVAFWKGTAELFETRYVNYTGPTAVVDCHLWTLDGVEVDGGTVHASAEQCEAWVDDAEFAGVLATNKGLVPVEPVVEYAPPAPEVVEEPAAEEPVV